jgi:hypothetical protein
MFSRILLSTAAAAALLGAAPALAADEGAARATAECCCPPGGMHHGEGDRAGARQQPRRDVPEQRAESDDPDVRNQSWGG